MTLQEAIDEFATRSKTYGDMEALLPDERLKISARSARDSYAEVVAILKDIPLAALDAHLLGIMVDAAGGEIVVGKEHIERANEGSVVSVRNKEAGTMIYRRVFEMKALDS